MNLTGYITKKYQGYDLSSVEDLKMFVLPKNKPLFMGVDPAIGSCGVYITDKERELHILLDFMNDGVDKHEYLRQLSSLIRFLLRDTQVELLVLEKHHRYMHQSSREALLACRDMFQNLAFDFEPLMNTKIESILPQSWRSKVIDKRKGKNRTKRAVVKKNVVEDLCDKYMELEPYVFRSPKSLDSFEALGILEGYLIYTDYFSNVNKVHKLVDNNQDFTINYWLQVLTLEELQQVKDVKDLVKGARPIIEPYKVTLAQYNEEMNFEDNLKYSLKNYPGVTAMLLNQKYNLIWAMWEYGIELMPNEFLMVFSVRTATKTAPGNLKQSDIHRVVSAEKYTGVIV